MFYFTARKIEEAPGHELLSVGGQHEKQAVGLVPAQVPSVKRARLRLHLFFRTLLGTDPFLASSRLCSSGPCLRLLLKVEF